MQIPDYAAGQAGHQPAPELHCIKSSGCPSRQKNPNVSQECILKVNTILGCTSKSVASKLRKVILCLLLGTSKTLPGGLCPVLDSTVQDGHWHTGKSLLERRVPGAHDVHGKTDRKRVLLAEGENKGGI